MHLPKFVSELGWVSIPNAAGVRGSWRAELLSSFASALHEAPTSVRPLPLRRTVPFMVRHGSVTQVDSSRIPGAQPCTDNDAETG